MKIIVTEEQIRKVLSENNLIDKLDSIKIPPSLGKIAQYLSNSDEEESSSIEPEIEDRPDQKIEPLHKKKLILNHPLGDSKKFNVGSGFNEVRGSKRHKSVDIPAPSGTPIYAPGNGKVIHAGDVGKRCGGFVKIHHGNYITKYCHLTKWVVSSGQNVKTGQVIGYVGGGKNDNYKGSSSGSHLHYEILTKSNRHINPEQPQFGFA